ncbi:hypothetical protein GDO78_018094 [Eleutherodactylus coqui]|uniref:Uncharacterized protein n=2 Tax=Eleutherodactylus coqui TaxID=57060 RepID=A0A8J6BM52_ELECQ|nr:hypothetical protein GDO78_018094 [Eleutherodactylus coqui]
MSSSCRKTALKALSLLLLLLQLLFAVCAGLLHYRFNGDISRREYPMVGYVFLSVGLSFVWRISVLIGTSCYKSGHKKFTAVPKNEMKTPADNPKGDSETPV